MYLENTESALCISELIFFGRFDLVAAIFLFVASLIFLPKFFFPHLERSSGSSSRRFMLSLILSRVSSVVVVPRRSLLSLLLHSGRQLGFLSPLWNPTWFLTNGSPYLRSLK